MAETVNDPETYTKWTVARVDPAFYSPATSMLDPKWYESRLAWMSNPDSYAPLLNMFSTTPAQPETTH